MADWGVKENDRKGIIEGHEEEAEGKECKKMKKKNEGEEIKMLMKETTDRE